MRHHLCVPAIALSLALTRLAAAQTPNPAAAEALFEAGLQAVAQEDYVTACPRFEQSQKLDPGDGTLLRLADCEEHLGRFASAARHWREAIEMLPPGDTRRPAAQDRATAADRRAARLVLRLVSSAPPDTVVKLDQAQVASAALGSSLPVDLGSHVVLVRAAGREDRSYPLKLGEGEQKELVVAPGPELAPVVTTPPVVSPPVLQRGPALDPGPQAKPPSFWEQHRWSLIGGGVAAGLAGAGLAFGIKTLPDHAAFVDACNAALQSHDQSACLSNRDAVAREATTANVLFGVAGAVAVASGVLFFTVESPGKKAPSVGVAPGFGGMTVRVRY